MIVCDNASIGKKCSVQADLTKPYYLSRKRDATSSKPYYLIGLQVGIRGGKPIKNMLPQKRKSETRSRIDVVKFALVAPGAPVISHSTCVRQ